MVKSKKFRIEATKVILSSRSSKQFQYCTYWRKANRVLSAIVIDPDSSCDYAFRIGEENYILGGGFYCNKEVNEMHLRKPISGKTELRRFEQNYDGQFRVPTVISLEDYYRTNPKMR